MKLHFGGYGTAAALEVGFAAYGTGRAMEEQGGFGWLPGTSTAVGTSVAALAALPFGGVPAIAVPVISGIAIESTARTAYESIRNRYTEMVERTSPGFSHSHAYTKRAVSMRQMALTALQNSPYNTRMVYGREAEILHR